MSVCRKKLYNFRKCVFSVAFTACFASLQSHQSVLKGIGIENLIYFIKTVLFLQADINMPLRNAETICGKGVFVYIGKRQAVYIRLNEENYNISN